MKGCQMELRYHLPTLAKVAVSHALAAHNLGVSIPKPLIEGSWGEIEAHARRREAALRSAAIKTLRHFDAMAPEQRRAAFLAAILDDDKVTGGDTLLLAAAIEAPEALNAALDDAWLREKRRLMKATAIEGAVKTAATK